MKSKNISVRRITTVAVLSALAFVLMMLEFALPFLPGFLKFDFSDLPALLASFALGPVCGVLVELFKNLLHLPLSQTSGIGELANFLIGSALVFPAGFIYGKKKSKTGALLGSLVGTVTACLISFPVNYRITYPFYAHFMPMDAILALYSAFFPSVDTLPHALLAVNMPFTFVKGLVNTVITFLIYKKISPLLKGRKS